METREPTSVVECFPQLDGEFDIRVYSAYDGGIEFCFTEVPNPLADTPVIEKRSVPTDR